MVTGFAPKQARQKGQVPGSQQAKKTTTPSASQQRYTNGQETTKGQHVPLGAKLVVGGIAGMVGMAFVFPVDLIKGRIQSGWCEGAWECVTRIRAEEGIRGFYRGLGACLSGVAPEKAIKLAVNEKLREHFTASDSGRITLLQEIAAGAGAGLCQVSASNPVEIVKIRLQMQGSHNAGLQPQRKPAMSIVRELGVRGLYKGAPVTLMRDVPFSFIFFPIYSNLRDWWLLKRHDLRGDVGLVPTLLSGASAGAIAAAAVTPADVVKTRVQVENSPYTSISQCARAVWREEGLRGFMRGAVERMAIQAPLYGIALLAFEVQKKWYLSHTHR